MAPLRAQIRASCRHPVQLRGQHGPPQHRMVPRSRLQPRRRHRDARSFPCPRDADPRSGRRHGSGLALLPGFWCRGFCPYGALLGLLSLLSPTAVNRNPASCSGCGRCAAACPVADSRRRAQTTLRDPECVGCTECVSACPSRCLDIRFGYGTGALPPSGVGHRRRDAAHPPESAMPPPFTGHWEADLPPQMIRMFLN